jgi:hypothetical protein
LSGKTTFLNRKGDKIKIELASQVKGDFVNRRSKEPEIINVRNNAQFSV